METKVEVLEGNRAKVTVTIRDLGDGNIEATKSVDYEGVAADNKQSWLDRLLGKL